MENYSRERTLRVLGISEGRLRYWEKRGLTARGGPYTLAELSELRRLVRLTQQGLRLSALLVDTFRQRWVGCSEGRAVVRDQSGLVELGSGQGILEFESGPSVTPLRADPSPTPPRQALDLMENGQNHEARICLEQALRQQPWSVTLRYNLAVALERLGQLEAAAAELERALGLQPGHADSHYNRARLLELLGRAPEARHHWERFLRLEPESRWADEVRRYLGATNVFPIGGCRVAGKPG